MAMLGKPKPARLALEADEQLSGVVQLGVAVDERRVQRVALELSSDGQQWRVVGASDEAPHTIEWDTTALPDGRYFLRPVLAKKGEERPGEETPVQLRNAPPEPSIVHPGDVLSGRIALGFDAPDAERVVVQCSLTGNDRWSAVPGDPALLDTHGIADGIYDLRIEAFAPGGQSSASRRVGPITIDNLPPDVSFVAPPPYTRFRSATDVVVRVSDEASGVAQVVVEAGRGEEWQRVAEFAPRTPDVRLRWEPSEDKVGPWRLRATATDHGGNVAIAWLNVEMLGEPEPDLEPEPEPEPDEAQADEALEEAPPALVLAQQPSDEPEPLPEAAPEAAPEPPLVQFPAPIRSLNIWELQRLVDHTPGQSESQLLERRQVLYHLREHTRLDGSIPERFSGLIADVFGDLISR